MRVKNTIKVFEIDNTEIPASQKLDLHVKTHWDESSQMVEIDVNGKSYAVKLAELLAAVINVKRSNIL